jgi:hypothetical protein
MKYGYARVSTDGQSVGAQVRQLMKAGWRSIRPHSIPIALMAGGGGILRQYLCAAPVSDKTLFIPARSRPSSPPSTMLWSTIDISARDRVH